MKAGSPGVGQHITPPKYNVKSTTTYITGWLVPGKGSPVLAELVPELVVDVLAQPVHCLLYTSPSPRDVWLSRMPSSA